jgi:hypothetical protein
MAHTAPLSIKRRRIEWIGGVVLALAGLAVAFVAVIALNHPKGRSASKITSIPSGSTTPNTSITPSASKPSTSAPASSSAASSSAPNPSRPALIVLNNTQRSGIATTAAERFRQGGWRVTSTGDFQGDILSTAAYYDPSVTGAQAAAEALQSQFPAIKRVKARFGGLPGGAIVVVLTSDYS